MYELIIANKNYSSWSLRPWVLMRMLGIPFSETLVPFPGGDSFDTYKPLSPNARVPCLVDGELRVWDSLSIAEYLAERHAGVWPADAAARAWARSAAAEMHSSFGTLRDICTMNCGLRIRLHERPAALMRDVARIGEIWTEGLDRFGGPFLAGAAFTAVDAFYAPVAFRAQTYGLEFGGAADAYAGRLLDLPAMRDWYAAALAEPWREEGHEAEARTVGDWTGDYRTAG
ncbi:glutathione S-transferase family protein [Aquibium sp. ELW1220]|uniref:glutathione S-transferase family protein n=1 Tax=Aquibium sp. ELW1220 TaxID=2976766 RepID=UPI0025AFADBE|nr:glutathione S-transferase family protein [Aquibium sp. ELW1220]MDN2583209.1 glutathione S-transferase family protein [Aquibium sp. ELW1220]